MTKEKLQELKKNILAELLEVKKDLLGKMRSKLEESFGVIPADVKKLPLVCLADGLERNYSGKSIMIKRDKETPSQKTLSTGKGMQKRPSVVLQVEDQSFIFDGDGLKMVGTGVGEEYRGMVDEINNILKKHMKKQK